jgi:acetyl esterase/lipase
LAASTVERAFVARGTAGTAQGRLSGDVLGMRDDDRMNVGTRIGGVAALVLAATLTACGGSPSVSGTEGPTSTSSASAATTATSPSPTVPAVPTAFDPAAVSQLFLPPGGATGAIPLVVLFPGGSWNTHDNSGLVPLARQLAAAGFAVVNSSYRAGQEGVHFPVPVHDVQCAIAYAAKTAASHGITGGPLIVVGHSAGGHLAALAAVSGDALRPLCPVPPITGFVGLGGVYDTALFEPYLTDFFHAARIGHLALWASGDPIAYVAAGKAPKLLQVLLIAGGQDFDVPMNQAQAFDAALREAHVPVTLTVAAGARHADLYTPVVAATPIITWVKALRR